MSLKDTLKKKPMSADDMERAAEAIHNKPKDIKDTKEVKTGDKHRLTIDLPAWLVKKMKKDTEHTGQTLKGIVLQLLLEKYSDK